MYSKGPRAGYVEQNSCLAEDLGVTKFMTIIARIWSHVAVLVKSDFVVQQNHLEQLPIGSSEVYSDEAIGQICNQFHDGFMGTTYLMFASKAGAYPSESV
jgi:hypothetical protein